MSYDVWTDVQLGDYEAYYRDRNHDIRYSIPRIMSRPLDPMQVVLLGALTARYRPVVQAFRLWILGDSAYRAHLALEDSLGRDIPVATYWQPTETYALLREASREPRVWQHVGPYLGASALAVIAGRRLGRLPRRSRQHPTRSRPGTAHVPRRRTLIAATATRLLAQPRRSDVGDAVEALFTAVASEGGPTPQIRDYHTWPNTIWTPSKIPDQGSFRLPKYRDFLR